RPNAWRCYPEGRRRAPPFDCGALHHSSHRSVQRPANHALALRIAPRSRELVTDLVDRIRAANAFPGLTRRPGTHVLNVVAQAHASFGMQVRPRQALEGEFEIAVRIAIEPDPRIPERTDDVVGVSHQDGVDLGVDPGVVIGPDREDGARARDAARLRIEPRAVEPMNGRGDGDEIGAVVA